MSPSVNWPIYSIAKSHIQNVYLANNWYWKHLSSFVAESLLQFPFLWHFDFMNPSKEPHTLPQISAHSSFECAKHLAWVQEAKEQGGMKMQGIANGTTVL